MTYPVCHRCGRALDLLGDEAGTIRAQCKIHGELCSAHDRALEPGPGGYWRCPDCAAGKPSVMTAFWARCILARAEALEEQIRLAERATDSRLWLDALVLARQLRGAVEIACEAGK